MEMGEEIIDKKPSVQLVLLDKKLHFEADKLMNIPLKAEFQNLESLKISQYKWCLYQEGIEKNCRITRNNSIVIGIHPMYGGSRFRMKVTAQIENKKLPPQGVSKSSDDELIGEIEFTPTCDKKVLLAEWCDKEETVLLRQQMNDGKSPVVSNKVIPLKGENLVAIFAIARLAGYSGERVNVYREVLGVDDDVERSIYKKESVTINGGNLGVAFSRNYLRQKMKSGEVRNVTAVFRIEDIRSGKLIADFRCELRVDGRDTVEKLGECPLQPVVVGNCNVIDNNYLPCKYTQIDVEYIVDKESNESRSIMIFNEGWSASLIPKYMPIHLIGGKHKPVVKLDKYTTGKCDTGMHKGDKATLIYKGKESPVDIRGGEIKPDLKYDYGDILENKEIIEAWNNGDYVEMAKKSVDMYDRVKRIKEIFNYFLLPKENVMQPHQLKVETCRHAHTITFNMVPDIKWDFYVGLGMSYPDYSKSAHYRQLSTKMYNGKKSIREREKAAADARESLIKGLEFVLGISATYNDGQVIDMHGSIVKRIEDASEKMAKIMGWFGLDRFFEFKDNDAKKEFNKKVVTDKQEIQYGGRSSTSSKYRKPILPVPVFMDIGTPRLLVGGTWQYDVNSHNKLSRKGSVYIEAAPVLDIKAGVDLIACSQYIPVVGTIITLIRKGKDAVETGVRVISSEKLEVSADLWFNIYVQGVVELTGELEISDDDTVIALKMKGAIIVGVELGVKCEISAKTVTIRSGETSTSIISGELGIEGKVETGITLTPQAGYSTSEGLFIDIMAGFNGIILDISGEAKLRETTDRKKDTATKKGKVRQETERDGQIYGGSFSESYPLLDPIPEFGKLHFTIANDKKS